MRTAQIGPDLRLLKTNTISFPGGGGVLQELLGGDVPLARASASSIKLCYTILD